MYISQKSDVTFNFITIRRFSWPNQINPLQLRLRFGVRAEVAYLEACREEYRVSMGYEMRLSSHDDTETEIIVNYKLCNDNEKKKNNIRGLASCARGLYTGTHITLSHVEDTKFLQSYTFYAGSYKTDTER